MIAGSNHAGVGQLITVRSPEPILAGTGVTSRLFETFTLVTGTGSTVLDEGVTVTSSVTRITYTHGAVRAIAMLALADTLDLTFTFLPYKVYYAESI